MCYFMFSYQDLGILSYNLASAMACHFSILQRFKFDKKVTKLCGMP